MDLKYWGFRHWPFDRSFAADRFFASAAHEEALARLLFLVEEPGRTGMITGATGTGKSFLLKTVEQRAERLGRLVVHCEAMGADGHELLSQIVDGCQIPRELDSSSARTWNGIRARFAALALTQQPVIIVIDHFDHVDTDCWKTVLRLRQQAEAIRLKLTIILARIDHANIARLQETIDLWIELQPWTEAETLQFITSSIRYAGPSEPIITDDALASIHEATNGVPAKVISLCNLTLLAAMGRDQTLITSETVDAVANELSSPLSGRPQSCFNGAASD